MSTTSALSGKTNSIVSEAARITAGAVTSTATSELGEEIEEIVNKDEDGSSG